MEPLTADDKRVLSLEKKLDAIIFEVQDWRVFQKGIRIRKPFIAEPVFPHRFRGIGIDFENHSVYKVYFGTCQYISFYLFFITPKGTLIYYKQVIQNLEKICDSVMRLFGINADDLLQDVSKIPNFGKEFLKRATHYVTKAYNATVVGKLFGYRFGQDCDFDEIYQRLEAFNMHYIRQLIVHYAQNFELPDHTLLWDKNLVKTKFKSMELRLEYYPLLLNTVGNFYFTVPEQSAEPCQLNEFKVYSHMFRELHREYVDGTMLFGKSKLALDLLIPAKFGLESSPRHTKGWQDYLVAIKKVMDAANEINTTKHQYKARFEVECRIKQPGMYMSLKHLIFRTLNSHSVLNSKEVMQSLCKIKTPTIKRHMDVNLMPCLNTLKRYIEERLAAELQDKITGYNISDYFNSMASEVIIASCLYGNVFYRDGDLMFPKWITNRVGFFHSGFDGDINVGNWIFTTVQKDDDGLIHFQPLGYGFVNIVEELAKKSRLPLPFFESIVELEECLQNTDEGNLNTAECELVFGSVSDTLLKIIKKSALKVSRHFLMRGRGCTSENDKLYIRLVQLSMRGENVQFMSTKEFVELIFEEPNFVEFSKFDFLKWMFGILKFVFKGRSQNDCLAFQNFFQNYLEADLLTYGYCLCLSFPHCYSGICVAPIIGAGLVQYSNRSTQIQKSIATMLSLLLPGLNSERNIRQTLNQYHGIVERFADVLPI